MCPGGACGDVQTRVDWGGGVFNPFGDDGLRALSVTEGACDYRVPGRVTGPKGRRRGGPLTPWNRRRPSLGAFTQGPGLSSGRTSPPRLRSYCRRGSSLARVSSVAPGRVLTGAGPELGAGILSASRAHRDRPRVHTLHRAE